MINYYVVMIPFATAKAFACLIKTSSKTFTVITTKPSLLRDIVSTDNIDIVLISTTLVSNIDKTQEMVKQIRNRYTIKIILGGQAYKLNPSAFKFINADYCMNSTHELLELLDGQLNANT